jgi:hypothetical protein
VSQTLFLSETVTALLGEEKATADGVFRAKGRFKPAAGEALGALLSPGEVNVCLPPFATRCRTLSVSTRIGRQVTQNDLADAIQAALGRAGEPSMAVITAEPVKVLLDGNEAQGSPVGRAAQTLEMEVAAFLTSLGFLTELERVVGEAGASLTGVTACEEALAASIGEKADTGAGRFILCDGYHSKIVALTGRVAASSAVVPIGPAHVAMDLRTTFSMTPEAALEAAERAVLGRAAAEPQGTAKVAEARLEELAQQVCLAARKAGMSLDEAVLVGMPVAEPVERVFLAEGVRVRGPGLALKRTDPPMLALADGAAALASGTTARTAATAMQLSAPKRREGILEWLKRNF